MEESCLSALLSENFMKINSVEEAYGLLAQYLIGFIDGRQWDRAVCNMRILNSMARGMHWLEYGDIVDELGGFSNDSNVIWDGLDAALFLRDDLLATTGERIWGLTFTLYPKGKFNIEYDYNKPEDYEDTDELITGEEINQSLSNQNKQA